MSHTIYAGKIAKRRNSTLQPTLTDSYDVLLKSPTSLHAPTFTISAASFDYNYLKWDDRYYFITDVVSRNNSLWEVSAVCDVLATFKADILASTQFVSYSSASGGTWLADTRIPLLKSGSVQKNASSMNFLFTAGGFYVLSVIGDSGCKVWATDISNIRALVNNISQWTDSLINTIESNLPYASPSSEVQAFENFTSALIGTGTLGNGYLDAPNCIRSCIWVPFFISDFIVGSGTNIYLGAFDTGATGYECKTTPHNNSISINIPWQHNDWRRAVCEEVYLYLPLVGMVNIPSDEIVNESALTIEWSATATDGCIAYCVKAGNQVVGTYGANASVNYPIGISQQASAGEIMQAAFAGTQKTVSSGIRAAESGSLSAIANTAFSAISGVYDTMNTAMTRHNSCIGGIGGGAGVGLDLDATVYTVSHDTIVAPSAMQQTMGLPTMKPMALSTLTGYCQCANAHVAASGAEAQELDEIDSYLNSGFYIE